MIRFSNRIGQTGYFKTGSPDYIDVAAAYAPGSDRVTFATRATAEGWVTGDTLGVLITKAPGNYKLWYATWDATNKRLSLLLEEDTAGTISDGDQVTVSSVVTKRMLDHAVWEPQFVTITGTAYTLLSSDIGKTLCCTNSAAVTITVDAALPVGFHCVIVQEGAGVVSLARASTDTLNGQTGNLSTPAQFQSLYLCQRVEGAWIVVGA